MKQTALLRNLCLLALLTGGFASGISITGYTVLQAKDVVSKRIAVPLEKVERLMKQGKIAQANVALQEARRVSAPSAYERDVIERLQVALAIKQNNLDAAFTGYDRLIASARTTATEKIQMRMAQASLAYHARKYPQAIHYIQAYFSAGGSNAHMTTLLIQSYFLNNNYKEAMLTQQKQIDAEIRNGQIPAESQWQIMANCQERLGDQNGLRNSYIQLATYYSRPEYWSHVMADLTSVGNMPVSVRVEVLRFRLAAGLMKDSREYMEMAEMGMQADLPHLALKTLSEGYAKGILGADKNTERVIRLRNFIQKSIQKNQAVFETRVSDAKSASDGVALLVVGYDLVLAGQHEKGLALMQEALQKPIKNRDEAVLHYAMAELDSNQKKQAVQILKSIQTQGVEKEIATLWLIRLQAER